MRSDSWSRCHPLCLQRPRLHRPRLHPPLTSRSRSRTSTSGRKQGMINMITGERAAQSQSQKAAQGALLTPPRQATTTPPTRRRMLAGNRPPQLIRECGRVPRVDRLDGLHRPHRPHGPPIIIMGRPIGLHRPGHHGPRCTTRSRTTVGTGGRRRSNTAVSMEHGLRRSCCVPRGTERAVFQPGGQTVWFLCADSARRTSLPHTASSRVSCVVCAASSTDVPQASGARSTSICSVCCEQHRCVTGITCPQHQHLPAALSTHDHRTEA